MDIGHSKELVNILKLQNEVLKRLKNSLNLNSPPEKQYYQDMFDEIDSQLQNFQKSLEL